MSIFKKLISLILMIPLFGVVFVFGWIQFMEGYNPIEPTIDTKFTADYSEEKFDEIKIGMDSIAIVNIIGQPFGIRNLVGRETLWYFSNDGKCSWQDFAWLGREIKFDANGKVSEKLKIINYD